MSDEEKEALRQNSASKIVLLDGELAYIAQIFLQIPFEYGSFGVVGKRYDAIKDYLRWHGYKRKEWVPVFVEMGHIWARESQKN